jgi:hypothetical protein
VVVTLSRTVIRPPRARVFCGERGEDSPAGFHAGLVKGYPPPLSLWTRLAVHATLAA